MNRHIRTALSIPFALLVGACAGGDAAEAPQVDETQPSFAVVGVNVIPMDSERVLPNQTVLIQGDRIVRIAPADQVPTPENAQVIEGNGRYLMPGLAEMHAHIPAPQAGEEAIERTLYLYAARGVTTIRGMLGHPRHLELRDLAAREEIVSPRIFTSGPSFNGNSATEPEQARQMVREQHAAGYDLLKLHPGLSVPVFDAIVATANEVGIPFAGHVSVDVGVHRALEARQATIDHLDGYVEAMVRDGYAAAPGSGGFFGFNFTEQLDESKAAALVARTREQGVWNVPTQSLLESMAGSEPVEQLAGRPEMRYMPRQTVEQWAQAVRNFRQADGYSPEIGQQFLETRRRLIRDLQASGAGLLLGSDAPQIMNVPGFSIHRELLDMVTAGLTPYEALVSGTRNPAIHFGQQAEWGTVEQGRIADLILLDANPLENIENSNRIAGVFLRGRWMPAAEIDARLERIAAALSTN